jgi:hypothetical protein
LFMRQGFICYLEAWDWPEIYDNEFFLKISLKMTKF